MFGSNKNPLLRHKNQFDRGENAFSENTTFNGALKCDTPVYVHGVFDGDIETTDAVMVGRTARVVATIRARDVGVAGIVVGDIVASGRVEVYPGGRVYGDVSATALRIEEGAVFSGQSKMPQGDADPFLLAASRQLKLLEPSG